LIEVAVPRQMQPIFILNRMSKCVPDSLWLAVVREQRLFLQPNQQTAKAIQQGMNSFHDEASRKERTHETQRYCRHVEEPIRYDTRLQRIVSR